MPVQVQVTLEATGTMLLGTEIGAALTALESSTWICDRTELRHRAEGDERRGALPGMNSTKQISVLPNAGLPQNEGGHAVYLLKPEELAEYHKHFVVGLRSAHCWRMLRDDAGAFESSGRCGSGVDPAKREVKRDGAASSAYTSVPLDLDPKPLIVAEEMNTTTRMENFRNMVRGNKYDGILTLAKKLVNEGSHMLDLCCAMVGEDEKAYMTNSGKDRHARARADPGRYDRGGGGGRGAEAHAGQGDYQLDQSGRWREAHAQVLPMAKRYGAAVIALTIDEDGMALTAEKKIAIAKRIFDLATNKYGIRPQDLIFDALTLPISTGQEEYRRREWRR